MSSCVLVVPFEQTKTSAGLNPFILLKSCALCYFLRALPLRKADFLQQDNRVPDKEEPFPPSAPVFRKVWPFAASSSCR